MTVKVTELNVRVRRFLEEYPLDGNATQAALRAGYSPRTAHVQGHKLVRKYQAEIEARLALHKSTLRREIGITKERILKELACIGFFDMADFYDSSGQAIPIPQLRARARHALSGFEEEQRMETTGEVEPPAAIRTKKYRLSDKIKALALLSELLGFKREKAVEDGLTLEELVLGSLELDSPA